MGFMLRIVVESVPQPGSLDLFRFGIELTDEDLLDWDAVANTAQDASAMLRAIESAISPDRKPKAHWEWAQPNAALELVASPNGASPATLRRVVTLAYEGFQRAVRNDGQAVVWPDEFSPEAQKHALNILHRLPRLQQMIIEATDQPSLTIDADVVIPGTQLRAKPKPRRTYGSVDGVLKMLSGHESSVRAGLKEYRTGQYVVCRFDSATWGEQLGTYWNHRVVVEGWVAFDDAGRPTSVADVRHVTLKRAGVSLTGLRGIAPDITGGLASDEFISSMRRDG